jgi:antagonist of KipI
MAVRGAGRKQARSLIALRVRQAGLLTTVQDLGRPSARRWGIAPGGAADLFSARIANLRAGNEPGAAVLEMTASGGRFEALARLRIAMAGAEMTVMRNGAEIESTTPIDLEPGEEIGFGAARAGLRAYLAVAGGVDVPLVLSSRSTHLSAAFGGWKGRRLETGDELCACDSGGAVAPARPGSFPMPAASAQLRILSGPQRGDVPREALATLCGQEFRVSAGSNRVGVRLEGASLDTGEEKEIVPEGSIPGAVQIPPGGQPIVHLCEGPVTSGYPRIAAVISADVGLLAQLRPGCLVTFREVTPEEALHARREREMMLEEGKGRS